MLYFGSHKDEMIGVDHDFLFTSYTTKVTSVRAKTEHDDITINSNFAQYDDFWQSKMVALLIHECTFVDSRFIIIEFTSTMIKSL